MDVLLSVSDAAARLGVTANRLREMLRSGDLAGTRVGNAWAVPSWVIEQERHRPRSPGRPLSARKAWDALLALDPSWPIEGMVYRLPADPDEAAPKVRARDQTQLYRVIDGLWDELIGDPRVVRGGVLAAAHHGAAVGRADHLDLYVRDGDCDALIHKTMLQHSERPNVILHVVADDVWPFDAHDSYVPAAVAVMDLLDAGDDRAAREARRLWPR